MRKILVAVAALVILAAVATGVMTTSYTSCDKYASKQFDSHFSINDIRCDNLDYTEAAEKVTERWNAAGIVVTGQLEEPLDMISGFDCTYDIDDRIASVKKDHKVLCALNHYLHLPVSVRIPMKVDHYSKKFRKRVTTADFLEHGTVTETTDAYVDLDDPDFRIVEEVYGSRPDTDKYFEDILKCIELGQTSFQYLEENYAATPKVKSDDPKLLAYQKFCRDNLRQKIKYDLGDDSYTIPMKDLKSLLKDDMSGDADEDAVREYVKGIAERYDNVGRTRTFKSLTGKTFTIDSGTYGWTVDQEGETAQLIADINTHKDVSREPVWGTRGYGDYSLNVGNTYIDIDVSKQKLIFFKDGKRKFSSDVVTGCRNTGTTTPTGLFSVLNKSRNVTLKGKNADGSKYESFVSYWMAFLGSSYGMHDASWRSQFGGDIWIYSGSHGCVNMPPSKIPELYDMVDYGTPVIIHY